MYSVFYQINQTGNDMETFNNSLFLNWLSLVDMDLAKTIQPAFCTRGKNKGSILKTAPKGRDEKNVVWNAVMSNIAPARVQSCNVLFMYSETNKQLLVDLSTKLEPYYHLLNASAQRECEFNLYAMRHDTNKIRETMREFYKKEIKNNSK